MIMNVKVKVIKRPKILDKLETKLQNNNLSEALAKEYAKQIKIAISQRVNSKSGAGTKNLFNSIRVVTTGKKSWRSAVVGAYYYWYANDGRAPGGIPPVAGKLKRWASKSVKWRGRYGASRLAEHIAEFGTQGKFFHEVARARFSEGRSRIIKKKIGL